MCQNSPNLLVLAEICLLLPLQTVDVEHGFSDQNLTKTALRNRLGELILGQLDDNCCQVWHMKKNRRVEKHNVNHESQ